MRKVALSVVLLGACSGFTEVNDGSTDVPSSDGPPAPADGGGEKIRDGALADLGGKLLAGECCAKAADCVSNICSQQGGGPTYCNKVCATAPDDCPVGFRCDGQLMRCMPPPIGGYGCGSQVVKAAPQPTGGCCGKLTDCQSGHCINVGVGDYFCTQTCTSQPDNCPTGYACSTADLCATPKDSTCKYF